VKTRSSKRIDEYSSRINMYYLNYYYYLLLLSSSLCYYCCLSTHQFFVFFFSRRSEKRFLPLKIPLYLLLKRLETAAFTPQKIIPRANGNVYATYSSRSNSSISEHTFASQRIYLSQIHVFDIDSYTLLIVVV